MLVSVIVPVYRQEKTIKKDLANVYAAMQSSKWDFEVIAVVDGFVDKSYDEAKTLEKPNLRVFGYEKNRGKGYAVQFGMTKSKGDFIAFIDGGGDINPRSISMVLEHMEWYGSDIIVGSKKHSASIVDYSRLRRIYSTIYYLFVKALFGLKVRDTQVGLKVYKREVLEKVFPRLVVKAFAFDIEVLVVAKKCGFLKLHEAPVEMELKFTTGSKWKKWRPPFLDRNVWGMIVDTLGVFYRLYILRYYDDKNKHLWLRDMSLSDHKDVNRPTRFSIIIPVRGISDFLKESIEKIKEVDYTNFEVIIVTDNKETYPFNDDRFKIVHSGTPHPAQKRNLGASYASGDILAFLDDDAYPTADWLTDAEKVFRDKSIYALGAPAVTPNKVPFLERMSGRILETYVVSADTVYRHIPKKPRLIDDYPTVNLFVRKEAFNSIGGFNTHFWPGEDTKLCLDLVNKQNRKFNYDPRPVVYHHRRTLLMPHLRQVSRYGKHRGQFARTFPKTSRLPNYFVPALFSLGIILGPVICFFLPRLWLLYFLVTSVYLGLVFLESAIIMLKEKNPFAFVYAVVGIFWTHLVYGLNFVIGFLIRPSLRLKEVDRITGNYIGG